MALKKQEITVNVTISKSLKEWLVADTNSISLAFSLSARTTNFLKSKRIKLLRELLVCSRDGLEWGSLLTVTQFRKITSKQWFMFKGFADGYIFDQLNQGKQPARSRSGGCATRIVMKEIDEMLNKLGLKLLFD